jgi:hypothetical protein
MTIHTIHGYPTFIEVDAETGRTEVTFSFRTPSDAALFAGFMGNTFTGVEVLVDVDDEVEEEEDDD